MTKKQAKHPNCGCHIIINNRVTCNITCLKCSSPKKVKVFKREGYKRIEVVYD